MKEKNDKLYYTWEDYDEDMAHLAFTTAELNELDFDHVVGIYRGSLGMAAHVSNAFGVPMSIIGIQTRDGKDKDPYWIHNLIDVETKKVLIVDDIYDTGYTMKKVINHCLLHSSWDCEVISWCLFGKSNDHNVMYSQEHNGLWVVFPWEILNESV